MTNQNPIPFPPTDKFHQWEDNILNERENVDVVLDCVWKDGFQAGADQELEACCEWVGAISRKYGPRLRLSRRPKPPSLKELALAVVENALFCDHLSSQDEAILRRALEALPND